MTKEEISKEVAAVDVAIKKYIDSLPDQTQERRSMAFEQIMRLVMQHTSVGIQPVVKPDLQLIDLTQNDTSK